MNASYWEFEAESNLFEDKLYIEPFFTEPHNETTKQLGKYFPYKMTKISTDEHTQPCSEHRANYSFAFY